MLSFLPPKITAAGTTIARMTTRNITLADDAASEALYAQPGEQHEEEPEHRHDAACVHVRKRRRERSAQALAHVDDGVNQDRMLKDGHLIQLCPGIVNAAKEGDRHDHGAKDEADLLRLNAGSDNHSE